MPAVVSDPNSLTKAKLKRELVKHDVNPPSGDASKEAYVALYYKHVLAQNIRSEFSSDDEIERSSKTPSKQRQKRPGSPKKSPVKKSSTSASSHSDMDVYQLTDDELLQQLRLYNIECGPILDSTRRIYQKKLQKVLAGGPVETSVDPPEEEDYSDEEEPEPVPVPKQTRAPERQLRQRVTQQPAPPPEEYDTTRYVVRDEPSRTTYTSTSRTSTTMYRGSSSSQPLSADDIVSQAAPEEPQEAPKSGGGGLSVWVQLLIVLVVAVIIFLVFQNMEPAAKAPPRRIGEEV